MYSTDKHFVIAHKSMQANSVPALHGVDTYLDIELRIEQRPNAIVNKRKYAVSISCNFCDRPGGGAWFDTPTVAYFSDFETAWKCFDSVNGNGACA